MTQPGGARIALDDLTSNQLDQLYNDLDEARLLIRMKDAMHKSAEDELAAGIPLVCSDDRHQAKVTALQANLEEARAEQKRFRTMYDTSEARVNDLIDERDKLKTIVPDLEAATARAERAEAAIERVRKAYRRVSSALIAVAPKLNDPYPDAPQWTPWTRFVKPALRELRAALDGEQQEHRYLSTSCLHDHHDYCNNTHGAVGPKKPAECKFCAAPCRCQCHHRGEQLATESPHRQTAKETHRLVVKDSTRRYAEQLRAKPGKASADGHAGWKCTAGASLIAEATTPGPGALGALHATIHTCPDHRSAAEERIVTGGYTPLVDDAPPGHLWDPWPCGHLTAYKTKALDVLAGEQPASSDPSD